MDRACEKAGSLAAGAAPDDGHANRWTEKWGEKWDGRGACIKWTDTWVGPPTFGHFCHINVPLYGHSHQMAALGILHRLSFGHFNDIHVPHYGNSHQMTTTWALCLGGPRPRGGRGHRRPRPQLG